MTRLDKKEFVDSFSKKCSEYACLFFVRQAGLSSSAVSQLRQDVRKAGASFQVIQNRLAKRALSHYSQVCEHLYGPVGVLFSQDPVSAAKIVVEFSKKREKNFFPLAGLLEGRFLEKEEVKKLASLPSLPQLQAQLLALLTTPASRLLSLLQEPAKRCVRVLSAYSQTH